MSAHTPGPWHVIDLRATEMRRLGWVGQSIDRILITNATGRDVLDVAGEGCVIARVQFDNRPDELGESNLADACVMAAAPELLAALRKMVDWYGKRGPAGPEDPDALLPEADQAPEVAEAMRALAKAEGRQP